MGNQAISRRIANLMGGFGPLVQFMTASTYARRQGTPGIADFVLGNPHELPLPAFSEALRRWSVPQDKDWFAYKFSERGAADGGGGAAREARHRLRPRG